MSIFNKVTKSFQWGNHTVTLETGEIARQAGGAVLVDIEGTVVLATVVGSKTAKPGQDFFLTVDYIEKTYAAGKIRRLLQARRPPSEHETLTSRLIDRPIRPLFPEGFYNEVHVVIHTVPLNPEVDADIAAMIGVSAALSISGIPFNGPIGAARAGYVNGEYVLNPGPTARKMSDLDLVVAGTESAVLMVESEAQQLSEEVLGGVVFGHEQMQGRHQRDPRTGARRRQAGVDWSLPPRTNLKPASRAGRSQDPRRLPDPQQAGPHPGPARRRFLRAGRAEGAGRGLRPVKVDNLVFEIEARTQPDPVRRAAHRRPRHAHRAPDRDPHRRAARTHGSALFTRGETQALVISTLGTERDAQRIDALAGEYQDRFLFHYNMPPFATGETGRMGSTKRREVGHGRLAKRALIPLLPTPEEFPYSVRVVSEITESNGSSSMASVCGGCLALMDAGVPMKAHVAGIAMGLIKDGNRFAC